MEDITSRKQEDALKLFHSERGRYLIGLAIYLAIDKILEGLENSEDEKMRENLAGLRLLASIFFPYEAVARFKDTMNEALNWRPGGKGG